MIPPTTSLVIASASSTSRTDRVTWSSGIFSTGYLGGPTVAGRPPLRIGQHGKITRNYLGDGVWLARCRFRDLDGVTRRVEQMAPAGVPDEYGARAEEALVDAIADRRHREAGRSQT